MQKFLKVFENSFLSPSFILPKTSFKLNNTFNSAYERIIRTAAKDVCPDNSFEL